MFSKQNENINLLKNDVYGIRGSSSQKSGAKSVHDVAEKFVAQKFKTDYQSLLGCPAMMDEITLSKKTTFHL